MMSPALKRVWKPACIALLAAGAGMALIAHGGPPREFPKNCYFVEANDPVQIELEKLVGQPMPPLRVADWMNGEVKPEDMKGKVVVIDIFATWCVPCIEAVPHTNELLSKHAKDGLVVVGVCSSPDGQDKLAALVEATNIKYPVAKDPDLKTATAYKVAYFPTYVIVDRSGKVRAAGLSPDGVDTVISKLLAEKAPA